MGIFSRVSRLIKSNANAAGNAVGKLQDPAKEVEQLVLDMEAALRKARQETAESMAGEKLARNRVLAAERELPRWEARAQDALRAGDEELAREALRKSEEAKVMLGELRREAAEMAQTAAAQQEALKRLEARLREVKARKATIGAKLALGKQQGLATDSLDDFQRMSDRIDDSENQGAAHAELAEMMGTDGDARDARDAHTEARLARLESGGVDERLAALKKKLEDK